MLSPIGITQRWPAGLAALLLAGCGFGSSPRPHADPTPPPSTQPQFVDVTADAGIRFRHEAAATGRYYFVETMGAGVAFLDYDGDGRQDLLFLNGAPLPGYRSTARLHPALYRNLGDRRFQDVTRRAGLALTFYGMGIAVGDYDADGDDDLYLTAVLGPSLLMQNDGGRFRNVAEQAGVSRPGSFPTSAAWLDYDRDGDLDLYVCNYVRYRSVADDLPCHFKQGIRSYCIPSAYEAEPDCLYQNRGNGTFKNVAREVGVLGPDGKSLGIAVCDLNEDGWPDLLIANDTTPTHAYLNREGRAFEEQAAMLGVAYGVAGTAKAGMGIDVVDDRNDGGLTTAMSNFSGEMVGFYRRGEDGFFSEVSVEAGVGRPSEKLLGFGIFFFDCNNDGWQDLFVANGHVQDRIAEFTEGISYRQPPLLLRNLGGGRYGDATPGAGPALAARLVARGAAWGDIDDDGLLDVAINNNQGPAFVFANATKQPGNWLKLRLVGTKSNRNAYGAQVAVASPAGVQRRYARSGSSYCSQSDQRLHFGLGTATASERVTVRWPSGLEQQFDHVPGNRLVTLREGDPAPK